MAVPKEKKSEETPQPVGRKRRGDLKGLLFILTLLAAVICYIFPESTLRPLGRFLYVSDELQKSDVIVVLLGGESPERVLAAEELYHRGLAPKILFGSGFVDKEALNRAPKSLHWEGSGAAMKRAFQSLSVPDSDLLMVDSSSAYDTSGELTLIAEEVRRLGFHHVILVTSATHSRRARIIWHRVASDIFVIAVGAPDPHLDRWWQYGRSIRAIGYEYAALVKEFCRRIVS